MSVYTIGDLHLSLGDPSKTMEVFRGWQDYQRRLEENWRAVVRPEDTVVLAGDISWAMHLNGTGPDFRFLDSLPGKKLLVKGNHDYWWTTRAKMEGFFAREGLNSLFILHNNSVMAGGVWLCGSRGWLFEGSDKYDPLVVAREEGRIRRSLEAVPPGEEKIWRAGDPGVLRGHGRPRGAGMLLCPPSRRRGGGGLPGGAPGGPAAAGLGRCS